MFGAGGIALPVDDVKTVSLSIGFAVLIASVAVYGFMLFGRQFSLDERMFPSATTRQRQMFGFLGYYLLLATGLEILNPWSLDDLAAGDITFKPGFLGKHIWSVSVQDWAALVILAGLLAYFLKTVTALSRSTQLIKRRQNIQMKHQREGDAKNPQRLEESFRKESQDLYFAFTFAAISSLIALISPGLDEFSEDTIPSVFIISIFLISGIYCFIESMRIGSKYGYMSFAQSAYMLFRHVIFRSFMLYIGIGVGGYIVYSKLPETVSSPSEYQKFLGVLPVTTKVIAGVVIILAAYLVAWGRSGLAPRIKKYIAVVAVAPLILPLQKMALLATDHTDMLTNRENSLLMGSHAILIIVVPILAYSWSLRDPGGVSGERVRSIAHARSPGIAPFVADIFFGNTNRRFALKTTPYATAEELLDDIVGTTARSGAETSWIPLRARYMLAEIFGVYENYDALILDGMSAIRLLDAVDRRSNKRCQSQYFIAAAVCEYPVVLIGLDHPVSDECWTPIVSGSSFLAPHPHVYHLYETLIDRVLGGHRFERLSCVPPNCVADFVPDVADIAVVPEPFGSQVRWKLQDRDVPYRDLLADQEDGGQWLLRQIDVVMVRTANDVEFASELLLSLRRGVRLVTRFRGPAVLDDLIAPMIAKELDGATGGPGELNSVSLRGLGAGLRRVDYEKYRVVVPGLDVERNAWPVIVEALDQLRKAGVVKSLTEQAVGLKCLTITGSIEVHETTARYPVEVPLLEIADEPGRLHEVIRAVSAEEIDLAVLVAQRTGDKQQSGFVYLLPKRITDVARLLKIPAVNACLTNTMGFIPIDVRDTFGGLAAVLDVFAKNGFNVEACFTFATGKRKALALVNVGSVTEADMQRATAVLLDAGFTVSRELSDESRESSFAM